ncbi:MAG: helix-turn-helix domain-containing protein [Solirubrobacteraceae bacterium]
MSTIWTHDPETNGATVPSPGIHPRGGGSNRASLETAGSAVKGTFDEVVEHPLTPEDVALLLRIDRETVYRMARRGELPAFKVSSRWRFLPSRLQRWMEEQERQVR